MAMNASIDSRADSAAQRPDRDRIRQMVQELAQNEPAARLLRSMASQSRLADLGELSCTIAHELRQPLFTIAMANENLGVMLESGDADQDRLLRSVARIAEQVRRAQAIIEHTLSYAAGDRGPADQICLAEAAERSIELLRPMFASADVTVERRWSAGLYMVDVPPIELEQVFVNVLRNAFDSIVDRRKSGWTGGGRIVIAIDQVGDQVGGGTRCVICDNGSGIAQVASDAMFRPFFTTKAREGTGLGLHVCRQILERAEGAIQLSPGGSEGAVVEIRLPVANAPVRSGVVAR